MGLVASRFTMSAYPHIFDPNVIDAKYPGNYGQYIVGNIAQFDPFNHEKYKKIPNKPKSSRVKSFDPSVKRKIANTAEVEISGVKPDINATFLLTATAKQLSDIIFDGSDPLKPLHLHRVPKSTESNLNGRKAAKNGRLQVATHKRPAVLWASEDGVGLMRGVWEEIANLHQLGLITLIYNVAKPAAIHYSYELTELLVAGYISDLVFIFGDPANSARQIAADTKLMKVIKEKTVDEGAEVYVAGTPLFNVVIRHLVAEVVKVSPDAILYQDWYHVLLAAGWQI